MTVIRLAVLDMAGTTVADGGLVLRAFDAAGKPAPDGTEVHLSTSQGKVPELVTTKDGVAEAGYVAGTTAGEALVRAGDVAAKVRELTLRDA